MDSMIEIYNGLPVASSKAIAEKFNKSHRDTLKAIRKVIDSLGLESHGAKFRSENFSYSTYKTPRGKTYDHVLLSRDAFSLVVMGFTGSKALEWKLKYIEAFNKMEAYIAKDNGVENLSGAINETSKLVDNLAVQGSAWGKDGARIRKEKSKAVTELKVLIDQAQMKLGFE